jgi:selenocysteine lyase/cysteine desulfurase
MIDLANLIGNKNAFPVLGEWTFFNHAGVSPLPRVAADQIKRYANQAQAGAYLSGSWYADLELLRKLCAKLINASPHEIAFVKNTSEGISIVANGIEWQWGDVIVTTAVEYPTNLYPWMEVSRSRGAKLELVPEEVMPDGSRMVPTDKILSAARHPQCKLIALSAVEYASGQKHELERIGTYCREHGILFCVDAIQAIGVTPIDVKAMKIDFASADSHKWMLGPEGAGFFYCRRELIERIRPLMVGWLNVINPHNHGDYNYTLKSDAGRFECGTYNIGGLLGMYGALALIDQVGVEVIEARVQSLLDRLEDGVRTKGYEVITPEARAGIFSFKAHGHAHELIVRKCREARVEIAKREGRLRASPHFYNTEQQVDQLIDLLPSH